MKMDPSGIPCASPASPYPSIKESTKGGSAKRSLVYGWVWRGWWGTRNPQWVRLRCSFVTTSWQHCRNFIRPCVQHSLTDLSLIGCSFHCFFSADWMQLSLMFWWFHTGFTNCSLIGRSCRWFFLDTAITDWFADWAQFPVMFCWLDTVFIDWALPSLASSKFNLKNNLQ